MPLPRISGEFTVGSDPTFRVANTGTAVASFSAVANKQKKNDQTGEWEDDKQIWIRVTAFKQVADHVAESVVKGMRVVINGTVSVSEYTDKDGNARTSVEVIADDIGVSIRYGTATFVKAERTVTAAAPAEDNPWASAPADATSPPF